MENVKLVIGNFACYEVADEFFNLWTFAARGEVIVAWGDIEEDDPHYDEQGDNVYPITDNSDRSKHPLFPVAEALANAGCYDMFMDDTHSSAIKMHCSLPDAIAENVLEVIEGIPDLEVDVL